MTQTKSLYSKYKVYAYFLASLAQIGLGMQLKMAKLKLNMSLGVCVFGL